MNSNAIKTLAILGSSMFVVTGVSLILHFFEIDDTALSVSMVGLMSAGTGIDFYIRLQNKYGQ